LRISSSERRKAWCSISQKLGGVMRGMREHDSQPHAGQPRKFERHSMLQATGRYIEAQTAVHLDEKLDEVCAITWCLARKL